MLASLLIVAVLGAALAKDVVNLRGAIGEGHGLPYGQKEVDVKEGEAALAEFIKSIKESEFATNLANGNLLSRTDKDVQNYLGGRSPSLTYQGHITAKKFDNLDCSGQGTSFITDALILIERLTSLIAALCPYLPSHVDCGGGLSLRSNGWAIHDHHLCEGKRHAHVVGGGVFQSQLHWRAGYDAVDGRAGL